MAVSTIPGIPATATSAAPDDYVELGGGTNGSRKILGEGFIPSWLPSGEVFLTPVFLVNRTGQTGGGSTNLDGFNVSAVPAPYNYLASLNVTSGQKNWMLRAKIGGDPSSSITDAFVVPTGSNPNNLIWAAYS
jgi:hypothetical protein